MGPVEAPEKNCVGQELNSDVFYLPQMIVNVCLVGKQGARSGEWVLVDAGLSTSVAPIREAAEERFGVNSRPGAIILTHGHFDHVGAVQELADYWNVPVYAHEKEIPYLTGQMDYPPAKPYVGGGLMARISPLYPHHGINLGERVQMLPGDGTVPGMEGWRWIHTPGHTPGHVSLFRDSDRLLIAGDAFITVNQESMMAVLTQKKEVNGPPAYFTMDWAAAQTSVRRLMELHPALVITGHGKPMCGDRLAEELEDLVRDLQGLAAQDKLD